VERLCRGDRALGVAGLDVGRGLLAFSSAAVILVWGGAAAAQVAGPGLGLPGEGMASVGPSFGPPTAPVERRFDVILLGTAVYDSNVAQGGALVQAARGLTPAEEIYSPSVTIDIARPIGPGSVALGGSVGYDFHESNTKLQSERINLNGSGQTGLGRCGLDVGGSFQRGQSDLSDLTLAVTENIQQAFSGSVGAQCAPFTGLGFGINYLYSQTTNTAAGVLVANSHVQGVSGGVSYSNDRLGKLALSGRYTTTDYDRAGPNQFTQPGYSSLEASLSLSRDISQRLSGSASVGISHVTPGKSPTGPTASDFTGFTGSGQLTYQVNDRLQAYLSYARAINPSLQLGADYQLSQTIGFTVNYELSERLSASIGGILGSHSFEGGTALLADGVRSDHSEQVIGSIRLKIGQKSSLTLNANYEVRNADPAIFDYNSYRVGLTASTSF
jgi:Putative beta-barrel porin 2